MTSAVEPTPPDPAPARRRGRPRNEGLRRTILRAAAELLEEHGVEGVTIEAIAERAAVGKQTIYRRWSSRAAVLVEAFLSQDDLAIDHQPDTGSLRKDLAAFASALTMTANREALRRSVAGLVAASHADAEVGRLFRERFVAPARAALRQVLARASERGELHQDLDEEVALDAILGAVWYRALLSGGRLDDTYAETLAATVVQGVLSREHRAAASEPRRPLRGRVMEEIETIDLFGNLNREGQDSAR
jgi:AcrR family transcriptional regulator